jgi:DNA recombination protein RmuC
MLITLSVLELSLLLTAGVLVGLLSGWWLLKYRLAPRLVRYKADADALLNTLHEKKEELDDLKNQLTTSQTEIKTQTEQLLAVSQERSVALSKLEQMASLETSLETREKEISDIQATNTHLKEQIATLETSIKKEQSSFDEKVSLLQELRTSLTETYQALSASALKENNQVFIDLAQTTFSKYIESAKTDFDARGKAVKESVVPLQEALNRYDEHIQAMERSREKAYGGLSAQVQSLIQTQDILQKETGKLVNALRVPHIRGRWGEITLRRVAELSGMQNHCDFYEQASARSEEGLLRPDMVVHLPGQRQIIIDAKVPLVAYIDALETASEEQREDHLSTHARHVKTHINQLSQKAYWTQFQPTPEFVVLFIPGENFFSAALSKDPQLIEIGVRKNVILATPTTLISLLKTVAFGWQQEKLAENARKISELGTELFERLSTMGQHINNLGRDIERCTQTYNKVVGSLERRVFSSARKFKELGITQKDENKTLTVAHIESTTRTLRIDDSG